jgi:hypothetical protein
MKKEDTMNSIMDFGLLAFVGVVWLVTMMAYGACIAAARADRFTQQNLLTLNTLASGQAGEERQNRTRI